MVLSEFILSELTSVLARLLISNADYLIDLLALAAHYPIITPAHFWEKHVLWKEALH